MNKIEYDSFYKFVISIGVVMIVFPIVGLNIFLGNKYDLILTVNEIEMLTEKAKSIVEKRQYILGHIVELMPMVFTMSVILGACAVLFGSIKWYKIQKLVDEKHKLENKHLEKQIHQLSLEEVATNIIKYEDGINSDNVQEFMNTFGNAFIMKNAGIEFIKKEYYTSNGNYTVEPYIKIGNTNYDLIAEGRGLLDKDYIYEIKYAQGLINEKWVNSIFNRLKDKRSIYSDIKNRMPYAVLIIISKSENYEKIKNVVDHYLKTNKHNNSTIKVIKENEVKVVQ